MYDYDDNLSKKLVVINNTSTIMTWVKGYELSMIRQGQPEWRIASYQWYEYNDDLNEGLPVINDTSTMTNLEKSCKLMTI